MEVDKLKDFFSDIYDRYYINIYRFIFVKTPSKETAQDIASDVFTKFFLHIRRNGIESVKNPKAFLYRIARNAISDFYNRANDYKVQKLDESITDTSQDIERKMDIEKDILRIKSVLKNLNPDYQDAVIFYYLEEISIKEICEIMDKSENNVRVMIHRAIKYLKENL